MPLWLLVLSACGTSTLFLKKDQYLFVQARIKGNRKVDAEALAALQQQKPNRQIPIIQSTPYLWFYQLGERLYDKDKVKAKIARTQKRYDDRIAKEKDAGSAKAIRLRNQRDQKLEKLQTKLEEGNWLMRTVGEPPSIFDPSAMALTAKEMQNYLFNKGFFDGKASAKVDTLSRRRIRVTYTIHEGAPQILRRIRDTAYDAFLQHIVDSITAKGQRLVEPGQRYDQDLITAERERLDKTIRNLGYYAFSREYIFVRADTGVLDSALGTRAIDLRYEIKNPAHARHERYRIGQADFFFSQANGYAATDTTDSLFNGIRYHTPFRKMSYRTLDSKVLVRPGEYYNADALTNSQAQLQAMDFFRFVNFSFDSLADKRTFLLNIQASRLPKYQISDEVGMLVSQGAPGPFVNLGFKVRNALNSFDIFEISGRYSQEGQISVFNSGSVYRARELGVNTSITFPAIVFPGFTSYLFNSKNPKTRLTLGYTSLHRPEYSQEIVKATAGYSINLSPREVVGLNLIDASLVYTTRISEGFQAFLDSQAVRGNPLNQSFKRQIVTSLSGFYVYNTASQTGKKRGTYLRLFGELGGFVPNFFADTYYATDAQGNESVDGRYVNNDRLGLNLRVFRFTKFQADYRYYYPTSKNTMWVARVNAGVAAPLGDSRALPYVKYFFSGGSNSIRAWAPRRLGPGQYSTQAASGSGIGYEQPGEVLFEANLELRQKLLGYFEGALFADAGNVFTLKEEAARPGGSIRASTFFQSLALGVGPGLRMDFSFLVVRLDMGIKTYDPAQPAGSRWVIRDLFKKAENGYQRAVFNIGIGYPF